MSVSVAGSLLPLLADSWSSFSKGDISVRFLKCIYATCTIDDLYKIKLRHRRVASPFNIKKNYCYAFLFGDKKIEIYENVLMVNIKLSAYD